MSDLNTWLPQQFLAPNFNLPTFDLLMPQLNFPWLTKKKLQEGSGLNSDVVEGLQDITSSFLIPEVDTIGQNRTLKSNIASSADTDSSNLFYKNGKVYADVDLSAYSATTNNPLKNIQNIQAIKKELADAAEEGAHIEGSGLLKTANAAQIAGMGGDILNSVLPKKSEYEGDKGNITAGIDTAYDTIANVANSFGPLGLAIGGIMKASAGVGKVVNKLGGGTDGMCVCAGTRVITADGKYINIEDLRLEDGIIGWGEGEVRKQTIKSLITLGEKDCLEFVFKSGRILLCSIDHPILSDNRPKAKLISKQGVRKGIRLWKFRRADALKVGDFVGVANSIDYWGTKEIKDAYVVGLLIGDGCYTIGSGCILTTADKSTWDYIERNNYGIRIRIKSDEKRYNGKCRTYSLHGFHYTMKKLGIYGQKGKSKTLPKDIYLYNKKSICNLIAGFFDTDGSININEKNHAYTISLYLTNQKILGEVQEQLLKLGIFCSIRKRKAADYIINGKVRHSKESYRLTISGRLSLIRFYENIPLNIEYKKKAVEKIYNIVSKKKQKEHYLESGAKQDKIISITYIGKQVIYNLLTLEDHTYLANNIITHNTTADAILGSNFLNMIPISWINGWGGSKTRSFTKDDEAFDEVGASYTGSNKTIDDALSKANKKYGLFSSHARKKANELIDEADRQLSIIQSIADNERNRLAMASVMTDIYGSDYAFKLKGGYNPSAMRIGKEGMKIGYLNIARNWLNDLSKVSEPIQPTIITPVFFDDEPEKMQLGGVIPTIINIPQLPTFIDIIEIPEKPEYTSSVIEVLDIAKFQDGGAIEQEELEEQVSDMKSLIKQAEKLNPRFILRLHEFPKVCKIVNENGDVVYGSHALEVFTTNDGKAIVLPTIVEDKNGLLVLLSKKEAKLHAKANDDYIVFDNEQDALYFTQHYKEWYPRYMSQWDDAVDEFRTKEANKDELFGDLEDVEAYQKGGEINVIPEGSLHAHKHNMDVEGITKKGIPVVSEEPNGELKQQAEIERAEIIFRLEVTQKLEELYNIYESEDTSKEEKEDAAFEAGKLLAKEINFNTVDNTNDLL